MDRQNLFKYEQSGSLGRGRHNYVLGPLLFVLFYSFMLVTLYLGSKPQTYQLKVNDASPYDIEAGRSVIDHSETEKRANEAMAAIPNKMVQSEAVSKQSVDRLKGLLTIVSDSRQNLYRQSVGSNVPNVPRSPEPNSYVPGEGELAGASTSLLSQINQAMQINLDPADARRLLEMSQEHYEALQSSLREQAEVLMQQAQDSESLKKNIQHLLERSADEPYFQEDRNLKQHLFELCLRANIVLNREATENAKKDAYNRVLQNPIMINRGSRIVSQGEIISAEKYALLEELDLIDSGIFDWQGLLALALYLALLFVLAFVYLHYARQEALTLMRQRAVLGLALLIPILLSAYIGRYYQLAPPVYFATVILASYFGFEAALFFSCLLVVAVLPIVSFNPAFIVVALIGCTIAALFSQGFSVEGNLAKLILATLAANVVSAATFSLIQHESWANMSLFVATSAVSGVASVIAAIGMMPLFELLFNTVSPLRLIELSQPGHPLLKRLFVEAPGTSQHSMMVATLADAAAEMIGAQALVARVGAYYHDIGKLEAPLMFTENQEAYNPHDLLAPEESTAIITRHPEDGLKLGRRFRLPLPVLKIIHEHHGTTVLQYFYQKARDLALKAGQPEPDINRFRYHTPIPTSRESAVVMLADSTEAAMKSTGCHDLEGAEKIMRNIFKIKNEQNQLIQSGLSFADVEKILQAFLQVYAGQFHERVKYPDATPSNSSSAEKR